MYALFSITFKNIRFYELFILSSSSILYAYSKKNKIFDVKNKKKTKKQNNKISIFFLNLYSCKTITYDTLKYNNKIEIYYNLEIERTYLKK
jgi:hypothetical protein